MAERKTGKAGIPKVRQDSVALQRTLDAIIERLEVLDGLRGDALDQAVTYRDLRLSGFTVIPGTGIGGTGTPQIIDTPGTGDGPGIGPADPPNTLTVSETFLALLISWNNPSFNLQHLQIFRADVDNLSLAVMIGTTVSTKYMDYVGANQAYYYWARSVGTDGTVSAFNDTAGTLGTTGIDPGDFSIDSSGFTVTDSALSDMSPFVVGTITNPSTLVEEDAVALSGQFIVDGTIRGHAIHVNTIGAEKMDVDQLSAFTADMGTLRAGRITTGTDGTAPDYTDQQAYRVEIQDQVGTQYPLWYGWKAKSAENGRFYVDQNGNVTVNGVLDAGMIKQSYFAPLSGGQDSFRIATEFDPGNPSATYSGGEYTGKKAHLFPIKTFNGTELGTVVPFFPITVANVSFLGPFNAADTQYGRLGSYSELFTLNWSMTVSGANAGIPQILRVTLQYQYDSEGWQSSSIVSDVGAPRNFDDRWSTTYSETFVTRSTAFNVVTFRLFISSVQGAGTVHSLSMTLSTPNFGYADASIAIELT